MIVLASLLFAIAAGCAGWLVARTLQNRRLVASRLSGSKGDLSFPYEIYGQADKLRRGKDNQISLEKIRTDRIAKNLYLAGFRNQKNVDFFSRLFQISWILPVFLVILYGLSGSLTMKNTVVAVFAGLVLFFYLHLFIRILKQKRQQRILRALPQLLDLLVVCVEAGLSFTAALERILKEQDAHEPLTQEFSQMYHEFLGGLPLPDACERLDKRCEVPDLSLLLSSIVQSDRMGSSLAGTLRVQAAELRDKLKQRVRTRAFQVPVKILFPMMLIFLAFILLNLGYIGYQMGAVLGSRNAKKNPGISIKSAPTQAQTQRWS